MSVFIAAKPKGRIALIGAPFDSTVSFRPGSRFAPNALREASYGLETFSFKQARDLEDADFCDLGDLELPFGDPKPALELIWTAAAQGLAQGQIPLLLGGEHLVSLGAVRAASAYHPELKIVHLDAHADLRDEYLGQKLSHATVMRRCLDFIGPENLRQMGVRSGTRAEFDPTDATAPNSTRCWPGPARPRST
ncbi:MAG: Agmatinase [Deltaproteobacteria bacterium ADurb.Bin510]|nr:MAG: Agmatinase [Deltaproteobacteria bacterium ADurb.Bin510]